MLLTPVTSTNELRNSERDLVKSSRNNLVDLRMYYEGLLVNESDVLRNSLIQNRLNLINTAIIALLTWS